MKIFAVCQCANEADIIRHTLSHLLSQGIDGIICSVNESGDKTLDILHAMQRRYGDKMEVWEDTDPAFHQSQKLTNLARIAVLEHGAEWVFAVDGDELWYSTDSTKLLGDVIRETVEDVISVPLLNHFETSKDIPHYNPYRRMVWRHPTANPLNKMIIRFNPDTMVIDRGNHRILLNGDCMPAKANVPIAVRHLSSRGADHFVRKSVANATALELAGEPYDVGRHCREYKECFMKHGEQALKEHYMRYFYFENPEKDLIFDPPPYTGD